MNVLLVYFSGTGITRYYAALIEEEFRRRGHSCNCLNIEKITDIPTLWQKKPVALHYTIRAESSRPLSKYPWPYYDLKMALEYATENPLFESFQKDWSQYDLIGFGSPVYAFRPAPVMIRFLLDLPKFEMGPRVFSFTTHDGAQGDYEAFMKDVLESKGLNFIGHIDQSFIYSASFVMRSSYNHVKSGLMLAKKSEIARKKANLFIDQAESIAYGLSYKYKITDLFSKLVGIPYRLIYSYGIDFMLNYLLFGFGIHKEECIQCNTCVLQCPQGLIEIGDDGYPIRHYHCMYCLRCLNWCPTDALYFSSLTDNKSRFTGPEALLDAAREQRGELWRKKN